MFRDEPKAEGQIILLPSEWNHREGMSPVTRPIRAKPSLPKCFT